MPRRERGTSEVVTIYWRDIPAQVNGQSGRERHQVLLSSKFQRAVDRAKRKAGIYTAEEDIAQWNRKSEPCEDHVLAAEAQAAALEAEYSKVYLGKLAYAGGFVADMSADVVDRDRLLALEELEDSDSQGET
jgi:hypothetical protein